MKKILFAFFLFCTYSNIVYSQNVEEPILLNHLAMYVNDLQKSTKFYETILRFKKVDEPFKDGKHTWFDIGANLKLHLIEGADKNIKRDKNDHLCFSVPSVEEFITRLEENKISYFNWKGDPQTYTVRVDGVKQIYFQDPDKHWIEINDDRSKK